MLEKRTTPADDCGIGEGMAKTEQAAKHNSFFDTHSNMVENDLQPQIADVLKRGEENAIPSKQLAEMLGFSSVRQLQQAIAAEVDTTGALILASSRGGYFLAADRDELLRYKRSLRNRARNTFRRLKAVNNALRNVDGQIELGGG